MPIDCDADRLTEGQCTMDTHSLLGTSSNDPEIVVGDVLSGGAFFIRTVVSIAILVSGLLLVFAGGNEKWADKWKNGHGFCLCDS